MYCTRCGKEIEITPTSRFCNGCGLEYQWMPVEKPMQRLQTPEEITPENFIQPIKYGNNNSQQAVLEKVGTSIDNRQKAGKTVVGVFLIIVLAPIAFGLFLILFGLIALIL